MTLALRLAAKAEGQTWPNPMVGAVIVKAGKIIGQGWHKRWGGPHAEIHALRTAGTRAKGATLYVTLEPCSHHGKTPPCAEAIIAAGIKTVIAAMKDPNPKVAGRGFKKCRQAGLVVKTGLMAREARRLNRVFIKNITTGLPYVISKAAMTLDGKIAAADGCSQWITGQAARRLTHYHRGLCQAVIIGGGTALVDDPLLTVRHLNPKSGRQPLRVVIEGQRPLPCNSRLVKTAKDFPLAVITPRPVKYHPLAGYEGVALWTCRAGHHQVDLVAALRKLYEEGNYCVMVEGGAQLQAGFLGLQDKGTQNLVDEIMWFMAPKIMGGVKALSVVAGLGAASPQAARGVDICSITPVGKDWLIQGRMMR